MEEEVVLNVQQIMGYLPHRYPFLLVDKVTEFVDDQKIVGFKNVTVNEPFFQGHFPGRPVMPGVMIIEALAQVGAIFATKTPNGLQPGKTIFFVGAEGVKFRKMVVPGDVLRLEMTLVRKRRPVWIMQGQATVNGKMVAEALISAAEAD